MHARRVRAIAASQSHRYGVSEAAIAPSVVAVVAVVAIQGAAISDGTDGHF